MFEIAINAQGQVTVAGRLDAAQATRAQSFLDGAKGVCVIDMAALEYISSAGLGVLLKTHKQLMAGGQGIHLINVRPHINDILRYSGFDRLFNIELAAG